LTLSSVFMKMEGEGRYEWEVFTKISIGNFVPIEEFLLRQPSKMANSLALLQYVL